MILAQRFCCVIWTNEQRADRRAVISRVGSGDKNATADPSSAYGISRDIGRGDHTCGIDDVLLTFVDSSYTTLVKFTVEMFTLRFVSPGIISRDRLQVVYFQ